MELDLRKRLREARLYLVCGELPVDRLAAALRGGVDLVQLRLKSASDERIIEVGRRYAAACQRHRVPLLLDDRPDLVAAAGADGVHVGQDDVPVARARELVGPGRLVGLSTHTPGQIDAANRLEGLDYIGVGPVHATPTKPGRAGVGLELVAYAAAHATAPFFAIGGIDLGNADAVRSAGARRIAVVRAITEAADPEAAAAALRGEARVGAA